jgi:predicted membrane metal-binding protein
MSLKNLRLRFAKTLSAILLASMETLAIFKSGFQMQNFGVNAGLRGGSNWGPGSRWSQRATQRLAMPGRHGELNNRNWYQ